MSYTISGRKGNKRKTETRQYKYHAKQVRMRMKKLGYKTIRIRKKK